MKEALVPLLAALAALVTAKVRGVDAAGRRDTQWTCQKPRPSVPRGTRVIFQWVAMDHCPETKNSSVFGSVDFRYMENGDVYADAEFDVLHPAKTISKLRQIIQSCNEDGSACEYFMTWDAPMDGCKFVAAKNAVWTPCFKNIRPPFECPIAATRYSNRNMTIDKNLLNLLPLPRNRLYKDRLEMWNEKNELFYCFILSFTFKLHKPRN